MNSRRKKQFILIISSFLLIFSYQNCAQQKFDLNSDTEEHTVTVIDDVNKDTAVFFTKSSVTVNEEVEVFHITGECSDKQNGAIFGWRLVDQDGVIKKGRTECIDGRFDVELEEVDGLPCGDMQIVARLGLGDQGTVDFQRRCGDAEPVEVASQRDYGACYREFFASNDRCEQACYGDDGGLISSQQLDINSCL